jgi:hypothetical protein
VRGLSAVTGTVEVFGRVMETAGNEPSDVKPNPITIITMTFKEKNDDKRFSMKYGS